MAITRRRLLASGACAAVSPAISGATAISTATLAAAQAATSPAAGEPAWKHAFSLFGDVKYPADFKRYDYVNPDAPKGGMVRQRAIGTFDNFNIVVAGLKGTIAGSVAQI